jgi:pantoate--beta-alanine ligase
MKTISSIASMQKALTAIQGKNKVGLVPTMGAFHEGHLSLMRKAMRECDIVVVSLFVNPLQFGHVQDLKRYPRDLAADAKMAEAEGVHFLFTPSAKEIVPPHLETSVSVDKTANRWEGAVRPGHFRGVATIVAKLFLIVKPDIAYFGQKDYQQTVVIRKMVDDLNFNLKLRILPTVRETSGLAKSSRNQFLSEKERLSATVLYRALQHARKRVKAGEVNCLILQKEVESILVSEPSAHVDYIAFCHQETLEPMPVVLEKTVLLIAVRMGSVRLIDNVILKGKC